MTAILADPYQFLAQNFIVSGSGRIEVPAFKSPTPVSDEELCPFAITVQNHSKDIFQVKYKKEICCSTR